MKTIQTPPSVLPIEDDPALGSGPDLDKACEPKPGDVYQVLYVVQGDHAVLVSIGLLPIPVACPRCHSFHVTEADDHHHCHECGCNFRNRVEVVD